MDNQQRVLSKPTSNEENQDSARKYNEGKAEDFYGEKTSTTKEQFM